MKLNHAQKERDDYQFLFESGAEKHSNEMNRLRRRCQDLEEEVEALQQKQENEVSYLRRLFIIHLLV